MKNGENMKNPVPVASHRIGDEEEFHSVLKSQIKTSDHFSQTFRFKSEKACAKPSFSGTC